jgi:hypothetical protein
MTDNDSQSPLVNPTVDASASNREATQAVWFFSGDLLFASRVESAAVRAGVAFSLMGKWPDVWTTQPRWIIVDLATRFGASADVIRNALQSFPDAHTIAFGPHVQPARLSKARQDGFNTVLTRGQFDSALSSLFDR